MATPVTTRVPLGIGAIHFIGIGGIGMSGIAEIMHNLGYKVQGTDVAENANVKRLHQPGHHGPCRPQCRQSQRRARGGLFLRRQARQCRVRRRPRAGAAPGAPRRNAGRDHAAALLHRHRRHQRQDHDHHPGRRAAGCGRHGSHRGQWRHHQCLWHQCPAGRGRMGGGGGRRKRRHLPAPARHRGGGDQRRSRSSRFLRQLRKYARRLPALCRECAVLRFRGAVHRPSRSAGHGGAHHRPAHDHLWLFAPGRCPRGECELLGRRLAFRLRLHRPPQEQRGTAGRAAVCPCRASTMSRTPWPPSWWRASWACPMP